MTHEAIEQREGLTRPVSDEARRSLAIRSPLNNAIYSAVREYQMGNMADADDPCCAYPLVDLMSNPAPADIGTGEMEMVALVDEIEAAVLAHRHQSTTSLEEERDALAKRVAELEALPKPWADHSGDLPEYDHPLACVFDSGVQYAVELLAKELGVTDWEPCDGTEEYDGDLGGTLMNIVLAAMPKDADGDPMHPREVRAALNTDPSHAE